MTKACCFERGEAIVLEGGRHERDGVLIEPAQCLIVYEPQESNVGARHALDFGPGWTVTYYHESGIGYGPHCLHNDLHVLVRQQSCDAEEIPRVQTLYGSRWSLGSEAGRGWYYFCLPSVDESDRI